MSIDILSESQTEPRVPPARAPGDARRTSRGRGWKGGLFALGVIGALAFAAVLITGSMSSPEDGPKLTHTITRGNLIVSVTEQGTLESAENTEIKCKVRGQSTVLWVVESGTTVQTGDVLVRLDTSFIEEQINERTKYAHWSRSAAERSKANVVRAELAVSEYEQGRYVSELLTLEKELTVAESKLRSTTNMLAHAQLMLGIEYVNESDVEEKDFAFQQAVLDLKLKKTQLDVLTRFTKEEELETLKGNLTADKANHKANAERATADASRRDRALEEFQYCVVKAEHDGLVIHPDVAQWETAPIAEGARVHKDRVMLLMPDLAQMQVKVGIHESVLKRMKPGLSAKVTLPEKTLQGTVKSVASITKPAGWWTGNEVRYDTIVQLPSVDGLRPGMSAEVEVLIARHENVLMIPVAAIVETEAGSSCWVKTRQGTARRTLELGDSNDVFTVVKAGLTEGDEVVLNPPTSLEAQSEPTKTLEETERNAASIKKPGNVTKP